MSKLDDAINIAKQFKRQAEVAVMRDIYFTENPSNIIGFCDDVLELLKEQNSLMLALDQSNSANEYLNEEVDKLNALLRQQQDEIAMMTKKAKSPTWRRGKAFCGSCGGCLENKEKHSADIVSSIRFCKWCGTPVDWSNE